MRDELQVEKAMKGPGFNLTMREMKGSVTWFSISLRAKAESKLSDSSRQRVAPNASAGSFVTVSTPNGPEHDNGWEKSAGSWLRLMEEGDPNRVHLLDGVMLGLCGEVRGLDVLDVGCGEGRFCRMLAARGARTVGIDPTPSLILEARRLQPGGVYHEGVGEALSLPDASVDLVVSFVALVDIPDFRKAISEMARVLRPGGRCVVANMNGFASASSLYWTRDDDGNKLYWTMDNYMVERRVRADWAGISVVNWHRPLSAYMKSFLGEGLTLEHFDEPVPKPETLAKHPRMKDYNRVPHFCTMVWRKPLPAVES